MHNNINAISRNIHQGCRGNGISIPIPTPYPYTWGAPYPRQSPGLLWGRNFYPHTHTIPIHMGSPIPTADLPYVHVSVEYFSRSTPQFQLRFTVLHTQLQSHNITIAQVTLMVFLMHTSNVLDRIIYARRMFRVKTQKSN